MKVLVTGATGFIGRHVARRLLDDGHDVVPVARGAAALARLYPGLPAHAVDLSRATEQDWRPLLANIDAVVNAVGILRERGADTFQAVHVDGPARLFRAAAAAGVAHVIHVSAIGADTAAPWPYQQTKGQAEAALDALAAEHPRMAVSILRPSLVYGPGGGSTALFAAFAALPVAALPGGGRQPLQPVHVGDLAAAVSALLAAEPMARRLAIVGPRPVSYAAMIAAYGRWLGRGRQPAISLPRSLMAPAVWFAGRFTDAPVSGDTWRMLEAGNVGDPSALARLLDRPPLALDEGLERHPATPADRRHARLYMLGRPLRWSLALLWIVSGVVSLGLWPVADSLDLLARAGVTGSLALPALYGAAALDIAVGLALFFRRLVPAAGLAALALMVAYTAILTATMPELWLHPFGALAKNVPLVVATLAMMAWEA